ncbi:hypothetical protein D3C87_1438710 [compost metagenome]
MPWRGVLLSQQAPKRVCLGVNQAAFDFEQAVIATVKAHVYFAVVQLFTGHCICAHESLRPCE